MTEVFQQKLDIEKKLTGLVVDSLVTIGFGQQKTIRIAAVPTIAAAGKKVVITSASNLTANIGEEAAESVTVTLDQDGQAEINVNGVLFGTTALKMKVLNEDVEATSMIAVVDTALLQKVKAPEASRLTGTTLYAGQTVTLSCESKGATIYYTTDGSCPCDSQTRLPYTKPIPITEGMILKIMSVGYQGEESEVKEYQYNIRQSEVEVELAEGWNWASHDLAAPLAVSSLENVASVVLTQEGSDFVAATQSMKIAAEKADKITFEGAKYNPALDEIVLNAGWNWLGYPMSDMMTLEDALTYLDAEEGDIISNLEEGFSVFTAGKWVGDLKALRPGQGYMYKSQGRKGFVYNSVPTVNARAIYGKRVEQRECPWEVNVHKYADMMCIIANVYEVDTPVGREDWVVGAFVGDECRGIGHFIGNELILPVRGKEGDELTFTLLSLTVDLGSDLKEHPTFTADAVGTMVEPLRLSFSEADAIHSVNGSGLQPEGAVYDLTGRRVNYQLSTINYQLKKGIYIINCKKLLRK
jgi:hypothetical protein